MDDVIIMSYKVSPSKMSRSWMSVGMCINQMKRGST